MGLGMVVPMQELTSLSQGQWAHRATCVELEERRDASLVPPSSAEPLNATHGNPVLSSAHTGEGKHDSAPEDAIVSRVPVVSADGTPLMPCRPAKARKLIETGKAVKRWSKLGIFYIQLRFNPKKPAYQPLAAGVDPGSRFEGFSVAGTGDTVLNIMSEAVDWVKKAVEQRRRMRRARRYRKTRCRPSRFDNRLNGRNWIPPSTKARWDAKLRIIRQLGKILPIQKAVVEDIKAETRPGQRRWNRSFSPLEVGKAYFYTGLEEMGLQVIQKQDHETERLRNMHNLQKVEDKSKPVFETHCVDAWVLAASETGAQHPSTRALHYLTPLRWHRRQPEKQVQPPQP